jgi:hypothetical protein
MLDFAGDDLVVQRPDVIVDRRADLADLERRQIAVVDPFLQRVGVNRLAEIGIGVGIRLAARRRGQADLDGGREIFEDRAPFTLVLGAAAVAFIDDDAVEKVGRVTPLSSLGTILPFSMWDGFTSGMPPGT